MEEGATRKRRRWTQFSVRSLLLLTLTAAIGIRCWQHWHRGYDFPDPAQVESIHVVFFDPPRFHECYVPAQCWGDLFAAISPSRKVSDLNLDLPIATLSITEKNGDFHWARFWLDQRSNRLSFAARNGDGEMAAYHLGNAEAFRVMLRDAYDKAGRPEPMGVCCQMIDFQDNQDLTIPDPTIWEAIKARHVSNKK